MRKIRELENRIRDLEGKYLQQERYINRIASAVDIISNEHKPVNECCHEWVYRGEHDLTINGYPAYRHLCKKCGLRKTEVFEWF